MFAIAPENTIALQGVVQIVLDEASDTLPR